MALMPASITQGGEQTNGMMRNTNAGSAPGKTGIDQPSDFLARGLGASWQVSVDPGSGTIANTYTGVAYQQSYRVANTAASDDAIITVPQAGSGSPRTDYLLLRIYDPEFAGQTDPAGKGCGLVLVPALPTGYPYLPICKITQPAGNTAGIQQSMITDLRQMASTGIELLAARPIPAVTEDTGMSLTVKTEPGEYFPNGLNNTLGPQDIYIPEEITRLIISAEWTAVFCAASKNCFGRFWVEWGEKTGTSTREKSTQRMSFNFPTASDAQRDSWRICDDVYVPVKYRGTTQRFAPKAILDSADTGVSMDKSSGMIWRVEGRVVADPEVR